MRKKPRNTVPVSCTKANGSRAALLVDHKYWKLKMSVGKHILRAFMPTLISKFRKKEKGPV